MRPRRPSPTAAAGNRTTTTKAASKIGPTPLALLDDTVRTVGMPKAAATICLAIDAPHRRGTNDLIKRPALAEHRSSLSLDLSKSHLYTPAAPRFPSPASTLPRTSLSRHGNTARQKTLRGPL